MAVTISHHQLDVWTQPLSLSLFWHEKLYKSAAHPNPFPYLRVEISLGEVSGGGIRRSCGESPSILWSASLIQRVCLVSNFNDILLAYHSGCLETGFELGLSFDSHTSDSEKHVFSPRSRLLILPPLKPFPLRCQYGWAEQW